MLKFLVLERGYSAKHWPNYNTYLVGPDGNALRTQVTFQDGAICCDNHNGGSSAMVVQYHTGECGELMLQTCLLPDRDDPYLLSLELARHRLLILYNKLEDWGMFHLPSTHTVTKRAERSRKLFIESLCVQAEDLVQANKQARQSLVAAIDASEQLALAHAEQRLDQRRTTGSVPEQVFGCGITLGQTNERIRAGMLANFDFLQLPVIWQCLEPEEGEYQWELLDGWAKWLLRNRKPVVAGPLISFEPGMVPDWLFIWEHDFDTVREMIYEHIKEVVKHYRHVVSSWNVISGLHVNNHFTFSFDQIMDLTQMATLLVKDMHPTAKVLVELRQPFGEYHSQNQQSIPPLMYADLLNQGAVNFDGLIVKLLMGQPMSGQYTRDLMQISDLLDQFAPLGKPVHVTMAAPSSTITAQMLNARNIEVTADANCGYWRKPWSELIQGHWLAAVVQVALSKPFVESVAWNELVDHPKIEMPMGGLLDKNLQPKGGFRRLATCRQHLMARLRVAGDEQKPTKSNQDVFE